MRLDDKHMYVPWTKIRDIDIAISQSDIHMQVCNLDMHVRILLILLTPIATRCNGEFSQTFSFLAKTVWTVAFQMPSP